MPSNSFRKATAVAAVAVGSLAMFGAPADAQTCYPPRAGCVTTTVAPAVGNRTLTQTGTRAPTASRGNLARTGAVVVPTALVGLGLVAGGVAMKRAGRRGKASTPA